VILRGRAARAVAGIGVSSAAAQLVTVLAAPVIARLYNPGEVGTYAVIASLSAVIGAVASLRWDFAVPLTDDESDAQALTALGLVSTLVVAALSGLLLWACSGWLVRIYDNPDLLPWLMLVPVAAFGQAAMKVLNQLAIRHRRYHVIATRAMVRSSAVVLTQVGLGLLAFEAGGLAVGLTVGNLLGAAMLLRGSGLRAPEAAAGRTRDRLRRNASRFRRFPLLSAPSGLLNVLGSQMPVLLLAAFYGQQVAGWFGLTQTAIAVPLMFIGQSVAQVYLGELSKTIRDGTSSQLRIFRRVSRYLGIISAALMLALALGGPILIPVVFGQRWTVSGTYAALMAPAMALQLFSVPLSQTLVVMERQGSQLLWDGSRVVLTAAVLSAMAIAGFGATAAVAAYSASSSVVYAALWLLARRAIQQPGASSMASASA